MIFKKNFWNFTLLYFILYFFHFIVAKYPGDDYKFSKVSREMSIADWISSRYMEWSSRVFPDTMVYLILDHQVWLWRIVNPLLIILLAVTIVRIWKVNISMMEVLIALMMVGFFAQNVLSSGVFWITGSMNYLWPISFGLLAMIPYADKVFRNSPLNNYYLFVAALTLGFLASIGNEQVSLCITCFALISHGTLYIKKQPQDKKLIVITIFMIIGTSLTLLAPGNKVRWIQEAAYWYPGFENLSLKDHLYIGTIWAFEKIFSDMKFLLFLLSTITLITYFRDSKLRNNLVFKIFTFVFGMVVLFNLSGIGLDLLYSFKIIKNFNFSANLLSFFTMKKSFMVAVFPYFFWMIFSLMLGYLMVKNTKFKAFVIISLLAFIATLVVMFFSPTIYGSGNRVLTVGSTILGLIITGKIVENNLINNRFYLCLLGCFPIINLSNMLYKWLQAGFNPFL
ncbi:MAG: DUF6056 family protein [Bacillus sp. (in: Bacteria)]|nr:DUF6056 family protein [Bacillus sp. (in: firmicutes)]